MEVMDLAAVQGQAAFMAQAAAQTPVSRDIRVEIISSSLVREDNNSSSRVIKAIRNS